MSDYSSYTERDAFNETLYNLITEYIENQENYLENTVLAINNKTMEIELGKSNDYSKEWETYPIQSLIRDNEVNNGKEVDIDSTHELASTYFFVK